jgi:iron(III) transport system ATP-binding protein
MKKISGPGEVSVEGVSKTFDQEVVLEKIELEVAPSETLSLLGPSGCGKTTLLRSIAGLENPEEGKIKIGDQVVFDIGISIAPEKRKIGMVFQDAALFPHMSVEQNVSYGLKKTDPKKERVSELLEIVGLPNFEKRRPETLSGGQKQRIALARALAPKPSVLLLDEPFSNLDSALRIEVRAEVHRLISELGITAIFVTHDQDEAFLLGDRVAVMNNGKILQVDLPNVIYEKPSNNWIASFVGAVNLVSCKVSGNKAETLLGLLRLDDSYEGDFELVLRPENLILTNGNDAEIETIEYYGHDSLLTLKLNAETKM